MSDLPVITYKKTWFNPLFFVLEDILDNKPAISNIFIYGGKSSSKTATICQQFVKRGLENRQSSMLFRKESSRVKTTIKQSFKLGVETTRLWDGWKMFEREFRSVTGAEAILTGLDSEDKAKGVEGFDFVLFDELDQFDPKEYEQADLSLRGEGGKVLFATWNPISKYSWVKLELVDSYEWLATEYQLPCETSFVKTSSCGTAILIRTSYPDNYWTAGSPCGTYGFRDEKLIAKYNKLKKKDYNAYRVNVLGEWGNPKKGGEFYKSFKAERDVKPNKYNPELPIHISLDENVNPYITLSAYQAVGLKSWKIDEFCLEHPRNTVRYLIDDFKKKYPNTKELIYIYGDRTSLKQDTKLEKGQNFFTIVENSLKSSNYKYSRRLPNKNPSVAMRGAFINDIFENNVYGIEYSIGENCVKTIDDYDSVKEDSDGTKKKERITDKETKVSYEKNGHLTDTDDYFLCEYYKEQYSLYLTGNLPNTVYTYTTTDSIPKKAKQLPSGLSIKQSPEFTCLVDAYLLDSNLYIKERLYRNDLLPVYIEDEKSIVSALEEIKHSKKHLLVVNSNSVAERKDLMKHKYIQKGIKELVSEGIKSVRGYNLIVTKDSLNIIKELDSWCWKIGSDGKSMAEPETKEPTALTAIRNVAMSKPIWNIK